jgi:hypothetical protein
MEPQLGFFYRFPTWETDDELTYENNGTGRRVGFYRTTNNDEYGSFVGTHRDYYLFAIHIPSEYSGENMYEILYIKNDKEIQETEYDPDIPYLDFLVWFVAWSEFPHPTTMSQRRTTSIRITETDMKKAWRKHLQNMAIARGKNLSAKKIAVAAATAPPSLNRRFSGGPLYKRAANSYKSNTGGSKTKKNKNKKKQ